MILMGRLAKAPREHSIRCGVLIMLGGVSKLQAVASCKAGVTVVLLSHNVTLCEPREAEKLAFTPSNLISPSNNILLGGYVCVYVCAVS